MMMRKRSLLAMLVLAGAIAFLLTGRPSAGQSEEGPEASVGTGFTFQGRLLDDDVPKNGVCDLRFKLFNAASGGTQLGVSNTVFNINISDGLFTATVNAGNEFGSNAFNGDARWLEVLVACPAGSGIFAVLSPRYPLNAAPYAQGVRAGTVISGSLPTNKSLAVYNLGSGGTAVFGRGHSFGLWGEATTAGGAGIYGTGTTAIAASGEAYGVSAVASNEGGVGLYGTSTVINGSSYGVFGLSGASEGVGVRGENSSNSGQAVGVRGQITHASGTGIGVLGRAPFYGIVGEATNSGVGVGGTSLTGTGIYGHGVSGVLGSAAGNSGLNYGVLGVTNSASGYGGYFSNNSTNGVALYAEGSGAGYLKPALRVHNTEAVQGMAATFFNGSNYANTHLQNNGSGQVMWLVNGGTDGSGTGGGDFITGVNNPGNDTQFRILTTGEIRSDVGFNTPAADFAEMLPAVNGLEAGDVLVIGPDGRLTQSSEPYQASVAGVYSTRPGFVGGQPVDGELTNHVPLAVVGVVPVKVSTENGAIRPGDMLTTASIPGHAMRAEPIQLDGYTIYPSGVVIGKALEGLDEGTGVIPMLVVLQ